MKMLRDLVLPVLVAVAVYSLVVGAPPWEW